MNIINNNLDNFANMIVPIEDDIILKIAQLAFKCKKDTERFNLRDEIYTSKYSGTNLEQSESQLEQILQSQFGSNVRTENQNKEYKWVKINTQNMGEISKFKIAIPKLYEQTKIASILLKVDSKIEEYENKKIMFEELKKGLMQQLLTGKTRIC